MVSLIASQQATGNSSTPSLTFSTAPTLNDFILLVITCHSNSITITTPTGYTARTRTVGGFFFTQSFWKKSDGTETAFSATMSGGQVWICDYVLVRGQDQTTPIIGSSIGTGVTSTPGTGTAFTPTAGIAALAIAWFTGDTGATSCGTYTTSGTGTGWGTITEQQDFNAVGGELAIATAPISNTNGTYHMDAVFSQGIDSISELVFIGNAPVSGPFPPFPRRPIYQAA